MVEPVGFTARVQPDLFGGFQQGVSTDNIGVDKFIRAVDGSVYMGLCCKMDNRVNKLDATSVHRS